MIIVTLRGGLGNQMFQYAAGLNLALKNKTTLVIDTVILNDRLPRKEVTFRTYDLDLFVSDEAKTSLSSLSDRFPIPGLWTALDLFSMEVADIFGVRKLIKEKDTFLFDSNVLDQKGNLALLGFWQNERYFQEHADAVRKAFRFRIPLEGVAKEIAARIDTTHSVSLHVRRGDYVNFKSMADMMGGTDLAYYDRAIRYVAEKIREPHFFIFSDDIEWCKENIKPSFPVTYLSSSSAGPKGIFHLELMARCKHNIIANSTFSWWAAWLNSHSEKIVIAPKQWYADVPLREQGIVPVGWISL